MQASHASSREKVIVAATIDHFIARSVKIQAMATEFQFANYRRRADVLIATANDLIGIEIKSKNDRIDRLGIQISDYQPYFDKIYVCCEKNNLSRAMKFTPSETGFLLFDDESQRVTVVRQAERKAMDSITFIKGAVTQHQLTTWLKKNEGIALSSTEALNMVSAFSERKRRKLVKDVLETTFSKPYHTFKKHRGHVTHSEDIDLLNANGLVTIRKT